MSIATDLREMSPMTPPGLKNIKIVELATKWRRLVPEEYADDICPLPPKEVIESYKQSMREKNAAIGNSASKEPVNTDKNGFVHDKESVKRMNVIELKKQLGLRKLRKSGKKSELIERLLEAIDIRNNAINDISNTDSNTDIVAGVLV